MSLVSCYFHGGCDPFVRFLWIINNLGKLYIGEKPMERPFDSTERISKILRYIKIPVHSKWRKNASFSPKSVILWVWVTQFWQIIPFFATSEQGQFNGLVYLEIWRHQKFKSIRVPHLRSDDSQKGVITENAQGRKSTPIIFCDP